MLRQEKLTKRITNYVSKGSANSTLIQLQGNPLDNFRPIIYLLKNNNNGFR